MRIECELQQSGSLVSRKVAVSRTRHVPPRLAVTVGLGWQAGWRRRGRGGRGRPLSMPSTPAASFGEAPAEQKNLFFPLLPLLSSENGDSVRQEYLATTELGDGLAFTLPSFLQGLGRKDEGGRPVLPW